MPKRSDRSPDDIVRMLLEFEVSPAADALMSKLGEQTFVGGRPVAKQKLPRLPKNAGSTIHQVKVTLYGSKPPIWRRLEVPSTMPLDVLHEVLQITFDWEGYHLHSFETPYGEFGSSDQDDDWSDRTDEATAALTQVAPAEKAKVVYVYDFGDDWRHDIVVEKIVPAEPGVAYPRCIAGRRIAPPEDCGGIWAQNGQRAADDEFDPSELTADLASLAEVVTPDC